MLLAVSFAIPLGGAWLLAAVARTGGGGRPLAG
jgi:hypothetical protein